VFRPTALVRNDRRRKSPPYNSWEIDDVLA
jgi:hypothetical protein